MNVDIQSLVLAAKRGDTNARDMLFTSLLPEAQRRSRSFASRHYLDVQDVETRLVWAMQLCLDNYDGSAPFENLVRVAWAKAQNNARRETYSNAYNRNVDKRIDDLSVHATGCEEDAVIASLVINEYKRHVANANEGATLAKVIDMIAEGGWTNEEIAYACGFEGTPAAAKMWTARKIDDLRRAMLSEGDVVTVRNTGTRLDGMRGVVMREADGDSTFTHVVRLPDGAVRSFRIGELERR